MPPIRTSPEPRPFSAEDTHDHPDDVRLRLLFRSRLADLLRLHPGEWALVDDSGAIETDVDKVRLLNKHHPANPHYFIIRQILPVEDRP
jgi:hypothetical protein